MDVIFEDDEIKNFMESELGGRIGGNIGKYFDEMLNMIMEGCSEQERKKATTLWNLFLDKFDKYKKEEETINVFDTEGMLIPETVCHIRMKTTEFDRFIHEMMDGQAIILRYNGLRYIIFSSDSLPTIYEEVLEKSNGKNGKYSENK